MGKNIINIALFGLGRIGQMHAENLVNHPEFNLKYIFDLDKNLTKKFSKKYQCIAIENPNIAFVDKNIKSIFIATSTNTHLKYIEGAVKNKKIVFCEKPLDLDLKKINQCKKNIKKYNPKIQIGFNRRYDPAHNSLRKNLIKGKIGKLEKIIITSRDPAPPPLSYLKTSGGIFKDMMIHDFDLARYYTGSDEFESVFATGEYFSDKKFRKVKDLELATVIMRSKKGVQCIITNSRHCSFGYDQRVELFGNKGMIISDNQRDLETAIYSKNSTNNKSPFKTFFIERYSEAYKIQLNDLAKLCKKNIKPIADFEDGRRSLILAETANKSLKSKIFEKVKF
ncbi:MAG: inositol 2-dehydrogenase [Candidatus Pelagibacter bacterium]|mgnify:FL=1|jgi:myo-inositol 2-dehydrogenase / D-chiro-inositol 1-dehydrogenase|nr:inositol 2-dehydrogenase [Pelagibacterales bacterium]MBL6862891.1 inositol 2-dehydrogenase [Candidatus Pelagibacter bacterium]